jgi:hypothetical protein
MNTLLQVSDIRHRSVAPTTCRVSRNGRSLTASVVSAFRERASIDSHGLPFAVVLVALLWTLLTPVVHSQSQVWVRQFGTLVYDDDSEVASDDAGGCFVGGWTGVIPGGGNADAWLRRYDSTGNQIWSRQIGTTARDEAHGVAPDGAGGVYICGFTAGGLSGPSAGNFDTWLARYDGAGNQIWIRQFGTTANDGAYGVTPDGVGGCFVCGGTGGPGFGTTSDCWLARFDGAGNQTWIQQFGTTASEGATAVAHDGAGGVYVSGNTDGSLGGPYMGSEDAWIAHYDVAGTQSWIRQLGTTQLDRAHSLAPDGVGGVYIGGHTAGSLGGPSSGFPDAWFAQYNGVGDQIWIRQIGTAESDWALALAPDGAGGMYVTGFTLGDLGGPNAGETDVWLARYSSSGNRTWIFQFGSSLSDGPTGVAFDGTTRLYLSGYTYGDMAGVNAGETDAFLAFYEIDFTTTRYCTPGSPNSTGLSGILNATGWNAVAANNLTVSAEQLPQSSFGFFLTSQAQGHVVAAGGSQGTLCLGGAIGRFVGPGQIMNSGSIGSFSLPVNLATMPTPTGPVSVQPGQTFNFQAWYRDANPTSTSNFTDAIAITFL